MGEPLRVIKTDNPRQAKSIDVTSNKIQPKSLNDTNKNETLQYVSYKIERPKSLNDTTKQGNLKSLNDSNIQGKPLLKNEINKQEISKSLNDTTKQKHHKSLNDINFQGNPLLENDTNKQQISESLNDTTKEEHSKSEQDTKKKRRPYSLTETVCRIFKQHPYVTLMPPSCKDILGSLMK